MTLYAPYSIEEKIEAQTKPDIVNIRVCSEACKRFLHCTNNFVHKAHYGLDVNAGRPFCVICAPPGAMVIMAKDRSTVPSDLNRNNPLMPVNPLLLVRVVKVYPVGPTVRARVIANATESYEREARRGA